MAEEISRMHADILVGVAIASVNIIDATTCEGSGVAAAETITVPYVSGWDVGKTSRLSVLA